MVAPMSPAGAESARTDEHRIAAVNIADLFNKFETCRHSTQRLPETGKRCVEFFVAAQTAFLKR